MKINKEKLRLNSKRGLLENDFILNKFLDKYEKKLSNKEINAFLMLTNFSDIDLLNLILKKKNEKILHKNIKKLLIKIRNFKI